jgi:hypothetical protein
MTLFYNSELRLIFGQLMRIIPKEYLELHARFCWEKAGRPEGKSLDFWLEAERFFKDFVVIPTEAYKILDKAKELRSLQHY